MKWPKSKQFFLSFLVLLFLSSVLYSEVCLTDEEAVELDQHLTTLEDIVTQQDQLLTQQDTRIETLETDLTISDELIASSKLETLLVKDSLKEAEISWRKQRLELILQAGSIGIGIGVVISLAAYFIAGR